LGAAKTLDLPGHWLFRKLAGRRAFLSGFQSADTGRGIYLRINNGCRRWTSQANSKRVKTMHLTYGFSVTT